MQMKLALLENFACFNLRASHNQLQNAFIFRRLADFLESRLKLFIVGRLISPINAVSFKACKLSLRLGWKC